MAQQWYCRISGKQYGPLSPKQLKQLAATGKLKPEDGVRRDSDDKWAPAGKVKGLFAEGAAAAARPTEKSAAKPIEPAAKKRVPKAKPLESAKPVKKAVADEEADDDYLLAPIEPTAKKPQTSPNVGAARGSGAPAAHAGGGYQAQPMQQTLADNGLNYVRVISTAATGAGFGFAAVCLAKIPILPLMVGVLGIIFALRAFALSKADRNALGLSFVAVVLSMVGFFWGLRSTMADPQPSVTLQEMFGVIESNPDQGVLQAGTHIGEMGPLAISIPETYVGPVPGVKDSKYYVVVSLRIRNESASNSVNYQSWSMAENGAVLEDHSGNIYGIVTNDEIKGQLRSVAITPGTKAMDVLVFENPKGFHDTLRLTLSGRAVGHPGTLVFSISHTVDDFRRNALGEQQKSRRAKAAPQPQPKAVEVGPEKPVSDDAPAAATADEPAKEAAE